MKKLLIVPLVLLVAVMSCRKDPDVDVVDPPDTTPISPVSFDLASVPYDSLSKYHFFDGPLADFQPSVGVVPFAPINALFSDYAHKSRFLWMPQGVSAVYESDSSVLSFPEGTVLIKNFSYEHVLPNDERRILETRLMFRRNGGWEFANYVWNAEQTEALYDMAGHYVPFDFVDDFGAQHTVNYRIPTETECHTCHEKSQVNTPIGPKPQSLNSTYAYADGAMNQLEKLTAMGYLQGGYPSNINTVADWTDVTRSLNDRVRGYLDANCSHCHAEGRYCHYRVMRFAWNQTIDPAMIGVCVAPADPLLPIHSHIVKPGNTQKSLLYYRISSDLDGIRMPLLGRTLVHEQARQLVEDWINSLTQTCD